MMLISRLMKPKWYTVELHVKYKDQSAVKFTVNVEAKYRKQAVKIAQQELEMTAMKVTRCKHK
jgi:hypothetical protein